MSVDHLQERARAAILTSAILPAIVNSSVTHMVIESRDDHVQREVRRRLGQLDDRDRQTIRDFLRPWPGQPSFEWRGTSEPLLWLPDAIAGAVREHLDGHGSRWFDALTACGAMADVQIVP